MKEEILGKKAIEIADMIKKREVSASEVTGLFLERIEKLEPELGSFITVCAESAREKAKEIDKKIDSGEKVGRFAGVPIAVKDVLCTKGIRTTCASKILENFVPVYDATVIERISEASMIVIGKTNMDEFAMGSSTENSFFGPTKNPWDKERVPGGSSGGSAAAMAAGEAPWAIGSDTGGSIRQPASLCGIVGLKPTYGLVSRYGLVAFASSLDQVGPMTGNVADCAAMLEVIAGHDRRDSTSIPAQRNEYLEGLTGDLKGMKVGIVSELSGDGIDEGVLRCFRLTCEILESLGVICEEVSLPNFEYALSSYYIIAPAEASSNLARYDGVRYGFRARDNADSVWEMYEETRTGGFGQEVKRRIMLGTFALSAGYYEQYYGKAQKIRTLILRDFEKAFERFDILVSPTSPTVAFRIGEKVDDPLKMYLSDICTIPVNLAGIPAMSIPCGLDDGLPVGFQLMGPALSESLILNVSFALEEEIGFDAKPQTFRA
ncbi:MAG: Asp-tRNA(Asn)/Glu-tRNA(Gln) amidotransferase subunit GatA [Actinomycetota bacterium]|nr:Asp-tRNA(Asn)/Glu-tRNA(Gln) amidotransferase subunit GatA [Actinomycetota bacterium]